MKLVSLYRDILAETAFVTLDKSVNGRLVHPITDPRVKGFISIVSSADALEIFKGVWHWKCKALKKNQKVGQGQGFIFSDSRIDEAAVWKDRDRILSCAACTRSAQQCYTEQSKTRNMKFILLGTFFANATVCQFEVGRHTNSKCIPL